MHAFDTAIIIFKPTMYCMGGEATLIGDIHRLNYT